MAHPYWPLADLRVRTPRVELRFAGEDDLIALARLAGEGIHPPDAMPFLTPWSVRPNVEQSVLQWHWRQWGAWTPDAWNLDFGAFTDNAASLGVSRALGYVENGLNIRNRQGVGTREVRLRLERADWEKTRRQDVEIEGIEPCLAMFGLD